MAWFAELKRRKWYCINQVNMIIEYKVYLYNEWYNSLSEEDKQKLKEYKERKKQQRENEARLAIMKLLSMNRMISGLYEKINEDRLL